ncbi:unnamed protein product [Closterium sp. NIES-53]
MRIPSLPLLNRAPRLLLRAPCLLSPRAPCPLLCAPRLLSRATSLLRAPRQLLRARRPICGAPPRPPPPPPLPPRVERLRVVSPFHALPLLRHRRRDAPPSGIPPPDHAPHLPPVSVPPAASPPRDFPAVPAENDSRCELHQFRVALPHLPLRELR